MTPAEPELDPVHMTPAEPERAFHVTPTKPEVAGLAPSWIPAAAILPRTLMSLLGTTCRGLGRSRVCR